MQRGLHEGKRVAPERFQDPLFSEGVSEVIHGQQQGVWDRGAEIEFVDDLPCHDSPVGALFHPAVVRGAKVFPVLVCKHQLGTGGGGGVPARFVFHECAVDEGGGNVVLGWLVCEGRLQGPGLLE